MPVVADVASAWRLAWPRQPAPGTAGERLGRGSGASLEFMDYRDYVPGDDLRHVDWRAYARTDQLKVRVYREEVAPAVEVVVDGSPSLAVTPRKRAATLDLVAALRTWGERGGGRVRVLRAGSAEAVHADAPFEFAAAASGALLPQVPLARAGVRVVLSDFLFPGDPTPELGRLAAGAAVLMVIQLLDPWELAPEAHGASALVDCEDGARVELVLDAQAVRRYQERLRRLRESVAIATRRLGGRYACVAADGLGRMCRDALLPAEIVEPV